MVYQREQLKMTTQGTAHLLEIDYAMAEGEEEYTFVYDSGCSQASLLHIDGDFDF